MSRAIHGIMVLALVAWLATGVGAGQEPSDRAFFVRQEVQLRQAASLAASSGLLPPGTMLTLVVTEPQGIFAHVRTTDGREGWVFGHHIRSVVVLEAEELLEPFGGLGPAAVGRGTFSALAAKTCPTSIDKCPAQGCIADLDHQRSNKLKRRMPSETHPATVLDFDDFAALQESTDHRGVPQGEVLSLVHRLKLTGLKAGSHIVSEGDLVALAGFIAVDRDLTCGGAESVNCRLVGGDCDPNGAEGWEALSGSE